jgi:ribosome-associated translation inhibitor RaiA
MKKTIMEVIMNKKQVKSYTLSKETIEAVQAYSAHSGNSLSQGVEYLILRGLENTQIAQQLTDRITQQLNRFIDADKKNTDRIIGVLVGQTRTIGKIYGVAITCAVRQGIIQKEELDTIFGSGIKQAMNDLKGGNSND